MELLRFALLGLGTGAIYGLIAQGIVVTYRGSTVLNLAFGAFAMSGAYVFSEVRTRVGVPGIVAVLAAMIAVSLLSGFCYLVVFRVLQRRTTLERLIGALGLLLVLQSAAVLRYGVDPKFIPGLFPGGTWELLPDTFVAKDRIFIFAIGVFITAALWTLYRYTHFGRVTTTVAETPMVAAGFGYSVARVALANWMIGGAVAGVAGALIAPMTGLSPGQLSGLVVPALAAALASRFVSFPVSFAAGVGIGVAQTVVGRYVKEPGWPSAVPLLLIAVLLVVRGRSLPGRGEFQDRLPVVGDGRRSLRSLVSLTIAGLIAVNVLPTSWVQPITVTAIVAILGLSVVVITGYAGQLSLATYALAGVGALTASRVAHSHGIGLAPALLIGATTAGAVGVIVGLPALRTRGPNLAIITLGMGAVIDAVFLSNARYSGGAFGLSIGRTDLFGWDIDTTRHPDRYATVVLVVLALVVMLLRNVRRGDIGRRLLAVRSNERAAASMGVSVTGSKLYAFGLSSAIAGLGGVLLAFQAETVVLNGTFSNLLSITLVGLVVLGSVGYPGGALVGATLAAGALSARVVSSFVDFDRYVALAGGAGVLLTVLINPNGVIATTLRNLGRRAREGVSQSADVDAAGERVEQKSLTLDMLSVRYGGTVAVQDLTLHVEPGQVLGLIGPNGAGKSSVIDAATGFARSSGSVRVGGVNVEHMTPAQRVRQGMSRSFQSLELFEDMTVLENLCARGASGRFESLRQIFGSSPPQLSPQAAAAVREFELEDVLHCKPAELSYGRRRLVAVARSLSTSPSVLLLDEPCAGLDSNEAREFGRLIRHLTNLWGMSVVLIEHNLEMVLAVCDEVAVLSGGRLIVQGTPAEITQHPEVVAAYIGEHKPTPAERVCPSDDLAGAMATSLDLNAVT